MLKLNSHTEYQILSNYECSTQVVSLIAQQSQCAGATCQAQKTIVCAPRKLGH